MIGSIGGSVRRAWWGRGIGLVLLTTFSSSAAAQRMEWEHFRIERLAEGVFAAIASDGYSDSNAGIIDLGDRTVVFDPFVTPAAARELRRAAEALTGRPVAHVVNSHAHYDHVRGNQVFADAQIIGTEAIREALLEIRLDSARARASALRNVQKYQPRLEAERDPERREELRFFLTHYQALYESIPELRITPPTLTFRDRLVLHGPGRTVEVLSFGTGHTKSDVILYLPGERIAFLGDLLFVERHPWLASGSPEGWIASLRRVETLGVRTVVPGHGRVGGVEELAALAGYIHAIDHLAQGMVAGGKTDADAVTVPAPYARWWWSEMMFVPNVRFMYKRALEQAKR